MFTLPTSQMKRILPVTSSPIALQHELTPVQLEANSGTTTSSREETHKNLFWTQNITQTTSEDPHTTLQENNTIIYKLKVWYKEICLYNDLMSLHHKHKKEGGQRVLM